ncbi:MAG: ABC transporter ATP-binding protein, partial [Bacillota bacterium]
EGLTRDFGHLRALDSVDLRVPQGSIFGFLGLNGAGKTTTIRLLLGLLAPTAGRAEVLGFDTQRQSDEVRTRCGALLENPGLYERLSARDNLEFFARAWRMGPDERRRRIDMLLGHMELLERAGEQVGTWSRGMKQRLAVARVLIHSPSVVFLDEPTTGLDPIAAVSLREDIAALAAEDGVTVFLTTHNLEEAEKLCDSVALIRRGRVVASGRPGELLGGARLREVRITGRGFTGAMVSALTRIAGVESASADGTTSMRVLMQGDAPTSPLVSFLVGQGAEVEEVLRHRDSLEDEFLALMRSSEEGEG